MPINAAALPALFQDIPWARNALDVAGEAGFIAEEDGAWTLSDDAAGCRVGRTVYERIRAAEAEGAGPFLIVDGVRHEVVRVVALGVPWIILRRP